MYNMRTCLQQFKRGKTQDLQVLANLQILIEEECIKRPNASHGLSSRGCSIGSTWPLLCAIQNKELFPFFCFLSLHDVLTMHYQTSYKSDSKLSVVSLTALSKKTQNKKRR